MRQYEQCELTIWPIQTQTSNTLTNAQKSLFFLSSMVVEAAAESPPLESVRFHRKNARIGKKNPAIQKSPNTTFVAARGEAWSALVAGTRNEAPRGATGHGQQPDGRAPQVDTGCCSGDPPTLIG
jgi:hypothetical protein